MSACLNLYCKFNIIKIKLQLVFFFLPWQKYFKILIEQCSEIHNTKEKCGTYITMIKKYITRQECKVS